MFCFIHAADLHLDSPLVGLESYQDAPVEQIRGAARRAFDNLIELATSREVSFVLLAGDLFDGDWKDQNTGIYLMNRLGQLKGAGIRVFMISGNHDAASHISRALVLPENVTLFPHRKAETRVLEEIGVAIHGQSFSSRAVTEDLSRSYPSAVKGLLNIGLLHTSVTGRPGHEPYAPCTVEGLCAKGYDYWALGHVHQREELSRDPWIVFPGNIQSRHVRETGPKGCTLVTVDEGHILGIEHHDLDVLRWQVLKAELGDCCSTDAVTEIIREEMETALGDSGDRPLVLRLVLEGCTPVHGALHERSHSLTERYRELAAGLGDLWLEKVVINTRKPDGPREWFPDDTPLSVVENEVCDLQGRGSDLLALIPELGQLRNKLPPELSEDPELFPSGPDGLGSLCEDVKEFLVGRMLRQGGRHED
jgi:DNA repair exonuclease SbcCD nuclease subunit